MFTGIIEEAGRFRGLARGELTIECKLVLDGVRIGDSISTNGICLTVTAFDCGSFRADVMPETMRRTSLSELTVGSRVNLERALRVGDRLGGHILSGHIDGVGRIVSIRSEGNARLVVVEAERAILRQVVTKGSIALDGMSLTVVDVSDRSFVVSMIPHSLSVTNFVEKRVGSLLNIETDLIGKYVERLLTFGAVDGGSSVGVSTDSRSLDRSSPVGSPIVGSLLGSRSLRGAHVGSASARSTSTLTLDFLRSNGF